MPLALDSFYNIAICTDCPIGIPFDWIKAHMKESHGLECSDAQVFERLNITTPTMKSDEVQQWISNNQVIGMPVEGIPVLDGVGCSRCAYSAKKKKALYNHISAFHREETPKAWIVIQKVQQPFKGSLKKYLQVESVDESDTQNEDIEDWELKLNDDFTRLMEDHDRIESSGSLDLRLMNAFIAKIRYTSMLS